jgi:Flp pilus assembly protein TadG
MRFNSSEKGQALILITLGAIVLFGFAALAIDGSMAYSDKRHAQNAADTAALAAGLARTRGQDYNTAAQNRATSNGYDNGANNDVTITTASTPSGACPSTGLDITVTITSVVHTSLARVIGWNQFTNVVTATARACDVKVSGGTPLYAGASVFATKKIACGGGIKDKAIFVQGSSQVQFWGGDVASASSDGGCLYFKGGEAQFKKQESGTACADILTAAPSGGTFNSVSGQDGCGAKVYNQTFADPPGDLGITCTGSATKTGSSLSPGNWTGTFPPAGVTTLQPGTYCVNGDFTLNGGDNLTGNGVTIVMNSGDLHWNGSSEVKLSAPTSGDYKGLLIYLPPGNNSDVDVNGNSNAKITGTILAQNSDCFFAGSGQLQKQVLQFICYTWGMDGDGDAQIEYKSDAFFAPLKIDNPTIALLK